ncbi:aldose epimerase family protein [Fodinibius sediminis]|uniref:Aldose 1-epimerase n=1 Tax=Fodinibius sediminis TaxID=1214077 RepID=A0A521C5T3_9BACT|nr:aldose epimerase family protein [Fodinibius sediminis]SMO54782.1 aldose 1-epimerase [Fodinibius sediminis]
MYSYFRAFGILFIMFSFISCSSDPAESPDYIPVEQSDFQVEHDGKQVDLFTLENEQGMKVQITNYGGKIVSVLVPDRNGKLGDVVLGYETAREYFDGIASLGATMGRYANRIAQAQFTLNDSTYQLDKNNGEHSIHGGMEGFRHQVWDANQIDGQTLELSYFSEDGEGGYPGNLEVTVTYSVTEDNELKLEYEASTDKPTVLNMTNHAFFNLSGEGSGKILDHVLFVDAVQYTPVDSTAIPTGELRAVEGTPFDFTEATAIGARIDADNQQLEYVGGYDHNYVLNKEEGALALAARLFDPESGRVMEVHTTEPGLQVYTANSLTGEGNQVGKGGHAYGPQSSVCLETQHFPDSPHHPNFPSTVITPDDGYQSTTIYTFSTRE